MRAEFPQDVIEMPVQQAERDAQQLLADVWAEDEAGFRIPVDPIKIAGYLGIDVLTAYFTDEDFSGALEKLLNEDPVIYLNRRDHPNRQRFTCAHELGHYYHRTLTGEHEYSYTDARDKLAQSGTDPDEIYANQFGAALIMPRTEVQRWHSTFHGDLVRLAAKFRVSEDAMRFRLTNLGLR